MEQEKILQRLLEYMDELSISVKYDRGNFVGGVVRYREDDYLYLNRKDDPETKIKTIINELGQLDLPQEALASDIREIIKQYS